MHSKVACSEQHGRCLGLLTPRISPSSLLQMSLWLSVFRCHAEDLVVLHSFICRAFLAPVRQTSEKICKSADTRASMRAAARSTRAPMLRVEVDLWRQRSYSLIKLWESCFHFPLRELYWRCILYVGVNVLALWLLFSVFHTLGFSKESFYPSNSKTWLIKCGRF